MSLSILPGSSLGAFMLGTSVIDVVNYLQSQQCQVIVDCDSVAPLHKSMIFRIPDINLELHFHPRFQTLMAIIATDLCKGPEIVYKGEILCGSNHPPTFVRIYNVLGPTFKGQVDAHGEYTLAYPGVKILFQIPAAYRCLYQSDNSDHPMKFPDGSTPVASKVVVELPESSCSSFCLPYIGEDVLLENGKGITFCSSHVSLRFNDTVQQVLTLFGTPWHVVAKEDERLHIHNPQRNAKVGSPNFFFCYPQLGIDVLFDGVSNTVEKIVCFNSIAPHQTFLHYHRCHYQLSMVSGKLRVDNNTHWSQIQQYMPNLPKPLLASAGTTLMKIYSLYGLIFHVLSTTETIASITLFNTGKYESSNVIPTPCSIESISPVATFSNSPVSSVIPATLQQEANIDHKSPMPHEDTKEGSPQETSPEGGDWQEVDEKSAESQASNNKSKKKKKR